MKKSLLGGGWAAIVPLTLAIGAYLFVVFFPTMRDVRALRAEILVKESTIADARKQSANITKLNEQMSATRDYLQMWRGIGARTGESSKVFASLAEVMNISGVATTMFRPEGKQALASLDRITVLVGCRGSYDQMQRLLASIERLNQRLWIEEVSIERVDDDGKTVACEVRLVIFADKFEISN